MVSLVRKTLETALKKNLPVMIVYQSGDVITQRSIRVTEIDGKNVRAYCNLRKRVRVFSIENILSAQMMM